MSTETKTPADNEVDSISLLSEYEKRLLSRMMRLYSAQKMSMHRDYAEENDFNSIKEKLLGAEGPVPSRAS